MSDPEGCTSGRTEVMDTQKSYKVWLVLFGLVLIYAGMSGILSNTLGVFFTAIIEDLDFRAGDLSVFYMIKSLVAAASVGFTTKMFVEKDGKKVMFVLEVLMIASFAVMALFHSMWQWYLAAIVSGIGGSCFIVAVPIVINNWFVKKRGLALGLTMSSSGIAGALMSPVFSRWITAMGWRQTVLLTSLICTVIILIPTLFLFWVKPEDAGTKAYGYEETPETAETQRQEIHRNIPGIVFVMITAAVLLPGILVNFTAQMPVYALSLGYTLEIGAMFTSWCMIGNVAGKLILGVLSDRIGIYKTTEIFLGAVLLSLVLFLFMQRSVMMLNLAAVLFGAEYAIYVNTQPLVLLDVYGPDDYKMKMSRLQSCLGLIGAFVAVLFVIGIVFCLISIILFVRLEHNSRRNVYDTRSVQ